MLYYSIILHSLLFCQVVLVYLHFKTFNIFIYTHTTSLPLGVGQGGLGAGVLATAAAPSRHSQTQISLNVYYSLKSIRNGKSWGVLENSA